MGRVRIGSTFVFRRRRVERLVLQQQLGQLVVDGRRFRVAREGLEELAVPQLGVAEVLVAGLGEFLVLVERVVVVRQLAQILLEMADHLRMGLAVEVLPVFRLQPVAGRKRLAGVDDQLGEPALLVYLDHPHVEIRGDPVERIALDERLVGGRRVRVTALLQIVVAEIAVDIHLIGALAVLAEKVHHGVRPAGAGEGQTDDTEGVVDALALDVAAALVEVVPGRDPVVQHAGKPGQRLVIQLLLVERPAELVQGDFVIGGDRPEIDDELVGLFGIDVFLAGEEILATPELHLVEILRARVVLDDPRHDGHRFLDAAQLFVGARHVVQHLVVAIVVRVFRQQFLVQLDRLLSVGVLQVGGRTIRRDHGRLAGGRRDLLAGGGAFLECRIRFGFSAAGAFSRKARLGRWPAGGGIEAFRFVQLLGGPRLRAGGAFGGAVFLLDFQVRQAADGLGRQARFRSFFQEAPIALDGLFDAAVDALFLDFDAHIAQIGQGIALAAQCARCEPGGQEQCNGNA